MLIESLLFTSMSTITGGFLLRTAFLFCISELFSGSSSSVQVGESSEDDEELLVHGHLITLGHGQIVTDFVISLLLELLCNSESFSSLCRLLSSSDSLSELVQWQVDV